MPLYLTIMLALPFNRLDGGWDARFHNMLLPKRAPGNANTQLLSVQSLPTVLEGRILCHKTFWLPLNVPAGPLHRAHVAAIVDPKLSSPVGYRYKLVETISKRMYTVRRLLGNGAPRRPRAQERPTTTPTRWYCHKCNSGPYSMAAQSSCTNVINGRQCDHPRCHYCTRE